MMDDRIQKQLHAYEERLRYIEMQWRTVDRLRNVFAVSPNHQDAITYNAYLAQYEVGPTTGTYPPGTLFNLNSIFYFPTADTYPTQYTKTAANLQAALAQIAAPGEFVLIHGPCTLSGDFTIPAGGTLAGFGRYTVTLSGTVTNGDEGLISGVGIRKTANDANTIYALVNSQTGTSYVHNCTITATQSGAGNAYAVGLINGLSVNDGEMWIDDNCHVNGTSVGGSGYGVRSTRGILRAWHSRIYGSTARYITT